MLLSVQIKPFKDNKILNMVVSLYVCDIPQNIERDELEGVFSCYDGFIDSRIARDKNK